MVIKVASTVTGDPEFIDAGAEAAAQKEEKQNYKPLKEINEEIEIKSVPFNYGNY